jgi:hypothetical protein
MNIQANKYLLPVSLLSFLIALFTAADHFSPVFHPGGLRYGNGHDWSKGAIVPDLSWTFRAGG